MKYAKNYLSLGIALKNFLMQFINKEEILYPKKNNCDNFVASVIRKWFFAQYITIKIYV